MAGFYFKALDMATGLSYLPAQAYGQNDHILSEMPQNFKNLAKYGKIFKIIA
jgi:hypothetical protein